MENDGVKLLNDDPKKKAISELVDTLKIKKKRGSTKFKPGNKVGLQFGQGQTREGNGRPKGPKTVLGEMRAALERLALGADDIAKVTLDIAMCDHVEPQYRIAFIKEINSRVFGQPKSSVEESVKNLENRFDKLCELTIPLLEATAIEDGVGVVRELMRQGKLEDVVKKVNDEG
jgi:hypothetical protein